jgi:hypothetical protein
MKNREWAKYKVTKKSMNGCIPLDKIFHVSHTRSALNIVSDGRIKAGLVYDESKLNKDRILVCWLSPNDWSGAGGYRYGNIRFAFKWKDICEGMNCYWVEVVEYGIPALRILLSDQDHCSVLETYNPESGDGPLWYDKEEDRHYWNGNYCLEIMVERDLFVSEVTKIDFVNHHPRFCCISSNCDEMDSPWHWGGSSFIAGIVGQDINQWLPNFYETTNDEIKIDYLFEQSCRTIWESLSDVERFNGKIKSKQKVALPLARAVLNAYAFNEEDVVPLAALFISKKSLIYSCAKLISEKFNISDWRMVLPRSRRRSRRG